MNSHRIEVLYRTNDHHVVVLIAHHLKLELFPSDHRFLEKHLMNRRFSETLVYEFDEILAVVDNVPPRAAERERGTDDDRKLDPLKHPGGFLDRGREPRFGDLETDLDH